MPLRNEPPTRHHMRYVVEQRNAETGALEFRGSNPFSEPVSGDQIGQYYYLRNGKGPNGPSASWEVIGAWYAARGLFWREAPWANMNTCDECGVDLAKFTHHAKGHRR